MMYGHHSEGLWTEHIISSSGWLESQPKPRYDAIRCMEKKRVMPSATPPQLNSAPVTLRVGNRAVEGSVAASDGIKLVLSLSAEPPSVPRVRLEFSKLPAPWDSVQFQAVVKKGMSTGAGYAVTVSIDRVTLAADRDALASLLTAWFPDVSRLQSCCREMMRGMGYELRKASLSSAMSDFSAPLASVTEPSVSLDEVTAPSSVMVDPPSVDKPASEVSPSNVEPAQVEPQEGPLEQEQTKELSSAVLRAVSSLLKDTVPITLPVGVQSPGGPYVYGLVYRALRDGKRIFLAAPCPNPAFGMRFELFLDVEEDGGLTEVVLPTEAAWFAKHPERASLSLFALRLASDAEEQHIEMWTRIVDFATEDDGEEPSVLPPAEQLDQLLG